MQKIKIESVGYDPKYYPRVTSDAYWRNVFIMKKKLIADPGLAKSNKKTGRRFPPIVVIKRNSWEWPYMIIDGLHRTKAHNGAGFDDIWAEVERLPESKWFSRAAELNLEVRCNLTANDYAWISTRLEADGWSEGKVAAHLQIPLDDLQKIKVNHVVKLKGTVTKIGGGKLTAARRKVNGNDVGFLKGPMKNVAGTSRAQSALDAQDAMFGASQRGILDAALSLLQSGALDVQDDAIVQQVKEVYEACRQYLTTDVVN